MKSIIVEETEKLLKEYEYPVELSAIECIIDKALDKKSTIIEAFKRHPNYVNDDLMIAIPYKEHIKMDSKQVDAFCAWMSGVIYRTYKGNEDPYSLASYIVNVIRKSEITDTIAEDLNRLVPGANMHKGQKITRAINKLLRALGIDDNPNYEREFAKWADAVTPRDFNRIFVLSVNPLDFYTMSFGNSWASCHTIDKHNKRGMPNNYQGCYSSGTESYMLDSTSIITYTVDEKEAENVEHLYKLPKINRQMFHYSGDKLVQGRLYPQDNDRAECQDRYESFRNMVQEVISECFTLENYWNVTTGSREASKHIISRGTHYHDYMYYNNCTLSTLNVYEGERKDLMTVGHDPICPCCGIEHDRSENICCIDCADDDYVCSSCGYSSCNEEDGAFVDGEWYCQDCCSWCECCEEYHVSESYYVGSDDAYVCKDCFNEYYEYCAECGEIHRRENMAEIDGAYYCEYCFDRYYEYCEECGEAHRREDMVEVDGSYYCENCFESEFGECEHCGQMLHNYELIYDKGSHKLLCYECREELAKANEEE